jgi:transcriptional regulator with XRE-family HTH domain
MATPSPLHRLISFHHTTARDAANVLGISERTLSAWLNGARQPSTSHLMKLAKLYQINPAHLDTDVTYNTWGLFHTGAASHRVSTDFLRELADPERIRQVDEVNIPKARRERQTETPSAV